MNDDLVDRIEKFSAEIRQGKLRSFEICRDTLQIIRKLISQTRWSNAGELLERLRTEGKKLASAHPDETCVANMFRRVMKVVRDEYIRHLREAKGQEAKEGEIHAYLGGREKTDFSESIPQLKTSIMELMSEELLQEIEGSGDHIAAQALDHIHSDEIIFTFGHSRTVAAFLTRACRKRNFQVMVAESAPSFQGHEMAKVLVEGGIKTTLVPDAAVFAIMSRVNQVIIGTHTIMADGGLKAINGAHGVCLAAKHHSVPVLVCAAMFKLSPHYPCSYDQDTFNLVTSPHAVLPYVAAQLMPKVHVLNPMFDYVPPDLITLFISNIGGNAPSYVYRLLSELYESDDHDISVNMGAFKHR